MPFFSCFSLSYQSKNWLYPKTRYAWFWLCFSSFAFLKIIHPTASPRQRSSVAEASGSAAARLRGGRGSAAARQPAALPPLQSNFFVEHGGRGDSSSLPEPFIKLTCSHSRGTINPLTSYPPPALFWRDFILAGLKWWKWQHSQN